MGEVLLGMVAGYLLACTIIGACVTVGAAWEWLSGRDKGEQR